MPSGDLIVRGLADDGLPLPSIKPHSLEKIRLHNYYARLFSTSMKAKWPQRAYVGLYSGAGRAILDPTGEIVETSALGAIRIQDPFTKYIFVDSDPDCTGALSQRINTVAPHLDVSLLTADVNASTDKVLAAMPSYSRDHGLLSFCFIDPFATDLKFSTIKALSAYKMDFLVLLMLGWDARVNFRQYFSDRTSTRLSDLLDCPGWRDEFSAQANTHVIRFLLRKFDEAMVRLGYLSATEELVHPVTAAGKSVLQYVLVLYSKHALAQKFWRQARLGSGEQIGLDFGP